MANHVYPIGRQRVMDGEIDLDGSTMMAALLTVGATYNSADTDESALTTSVVGTPQALSGLTVSSAAVWSADSAAFAGITGGTVIVAVITYADLGGGDLPLMSWHDLSLTTTGGTVTVNWSGTASHGNIITTTG